jgi:hypothetical protein
MAGSLCLFASTIYSVVMSHWPGPTQDSWHFIASLKMSDRGESIFRELLRRHAGHHIFFPKLLYLIEYTQFQGRNIFLVACSVALQTLTMTLLIRATWKERRALPRSARFFLIGLPIAFLFSATQITNFVQAWNLCWPISCFAVTTSIFALVRAHAARVGGALGATTVGWMGLGLSAAVVCTYSIGSGLLVWPALLLVGIALRLPLRGVLLLAFVGVLIGGASLIGYGESRGPSPALVLERAIPSFAWVAAFLGEPLERNHRVLGLVQGAVGAVAAVALLTHAVVKRPRLRPVEAVYLGIAFYTLGTGFLVALARMGMGGPIWAAMRYQTAVLLFWLSLIALATFRVAGDSARQRGARALLITVVLAWTSAVLVPAHLRQARGTAAFAENVRAANLAMVVGIEHPPTYETLHALGRCHGRSCVELYGPFLRDHALGAFAYDTGRFLGMQISKELVVSETRVCPGKLDSVENLADPMPLGPQRGARLAGHMRDPDRAPAAILVSDEAGTVIGLGARARLGSPKWIAYTPTPQSGGRVNIWALTGDGVLCLITGPATLWPGRFSTSRPSRVGSMGIDGEFRPPGT